MPQGDLPKTNANDRLLDAVSLKRLMEQRHYATLILGLLYERTVLQPDTYDIEEARERDALMASLWQHIDFPLTIKVPGAERTVPQKGDSPIPFSDAMPITLPPLPVSVDTTSGTSCETDWNALLATQQRTRNPFVSAEESLTFFALPLASRHGFITEAWLTRLLSEGLGRFEGPLGEDAPGVQRLDHGWVPFLLVIPQAAAPERTQDARWDDFQRLAEASETIALGMAESVNGWLMAFLTDDFERTVTALRRVLSTSDWANVSRLYLTTLFPGAQPVRLIDRPQGVPSEAHQESGRPTPNGRALAWSPLGAKVLVDAPITLTPVWLCDVTERVSVVAAGRSAPWSVLAPESVLTPEHAQHARAEGLVLVGNGSSVLALRSFPVRVPNEVIQLIDDPEDKGLVEAFERHHAHLAVRVLASAPEPAWRTQKEALHWLADRRLRVETPYSLVTLLRALRQRVSPETRTAYRDALGLTDWVRAVGRYERTVPASTPLGAVIGTYRLTRITCSDDQTLPEWRTTNTNTLEDTEKIFALPLTVRQVRQYDQGFTLVLSEGYRDLGIPEVLVLASEPHLAPWVDHVSTALLGALVDAPEGVDVAPLTKTPLSEHVATFTVTLAVQSPPEVPFPLLSVTLLNP